MAKMRTTAKHDNTLKTRLAETAREFSDAPSVAVHEPIDVAATNGNGNGKAKRVKAPAAEKEAGPKVLSVPSLNLGLMTLTIIGDSSLVCNRWSEKARNEMFAKQTKAAKAAKEAKDPEACYQASLYKLPEGGFGFPAIAFKKAAVDACSFVSGITKVQARGAFHVLGDLVPIEGVPQMREDMVRVGMGTADIRFRAEFKEWRCTITIRYNARVISPEQILNLFSNAGFSIGVGEGRPQKDRSWGMFHVMDRADDAA